MEQGRGRQCRAKAKVGAQLVEWMKSKKKGFGLKEWRKCSRGGEDNCHGGINIDVLDGWLGELYWLTEIDVQNGIHSFYFIQIF